MNMKINYSKSIAVWVWLMVWLGIGYVAYQAQQSRIVTDSTTVFTRSIEIEKIAEKISIKGIENYIGLKLGLPRM